MWDMYGICSKTITCGVALTHKFKQDENGSSALAKLKTGIYIAGDRGNVTMALQLSVASSVPSVYISLT